MNCVLLYIIALLLLFPHVVLSQEKGLGTNTIRFCAGIHEWPPYYYLERVNGQKTQVIKGLDIELFEEVFRKNGISYSTELLPWKKCLAEVIKGDKYDVVFGVGLNASRQESYITTKGYYSVVPSYFYNRKVFPQGINVKSPSEFKKYGHLCGVAGFNYANFGLNNENIEMGADDYTKLVDKTLFGRCNVSFIRYEILSGWADLLGINFTRNKDLVFTPIPNNHHESFHLMISKKYPFAHELKSLFESEVDKLKKVKKFHWLLNK